jgi:glutaredoxin-like protein
MITTRQQRARESHSSMSLLTEQDQQQLRGMFQADLARAVRLVVFTQTFGCETCGEARRILDEVAALSPRLSLEECNLVLETERAQALGVERSPTTAVIAVDEDGTEHDYGVRFVGLPSGYGFSALIDAILLVSKGDSSLSADSRAQLAALTEPVTIQVFSTPTCPHCPRAISLAHRMAIESPLVRSLAIEVSEFPDLIQRYRVNGVPKTVVNDRNEILGAQPEPMFIAEALRGLS